MKADWRFLVRTLSSASGFQSLCPKRHAQPTIVVFTAEYRAPGIYRESHEIVGSRGGDRRRRHCLGRRNGGFHRWQVSRYVPLNRLLSGSSPAFGAFGVGVGVGAGVLSCAVMHAKLAPNAIARVAVVPLFPSFPVPLTREIRFGQFRTLKLRNSARICKRGNFALYI